MFQCIACENCTLHGGKKKKKLRFISFSGRRTRAATATKLMVNGVTGIGSAENALVVGDFASPKRKDCKLDVDEANGAAEKSPGNAMNGKRGPRTTKRQMQPITNFFHSNGAHDGRTGDRAGDNRDFSVLSTDFPALPDAKSASLNGLHSNGVEKPAEKVLFEDDGPISPRVCDDGAAAFASPAPKLLNGDAKQTQTTPHRIVALSPSKKQRLYEKNAMAVFSNLNIGTDAASPAKVKTPKKRPNQRARRKLIGNGTENAAAEIVAEKQSNILAKFALNGVEEKVSIEEKEFKVPAAPPKVHETQLTDFFPIRRSVRKTKKAVEQEQERYIQMAIEKKLEDGLLVETFCGKGRGIVAGKPFSRGDFVVEYVGDLIEQNEADRREEKYSKDTNFGCYMYYFKHKEQQWW